MQIVELEKLCHSQSASTAATRAGLVLMDAGWMRYTPAGWDRPAIVAMQDRSCIGGLIFSEDEDDREVVIRFAFADPAYPHVFTALLLRLRAKYRNSTFERFSFFCHEGNAPMAKAVAALGLQPFGHTYLVPIAGDRKVG